MGNIQNYTCLSCWKPISNSIPALKAAVVPKYSYFLPPQEPSSSLCLWDCPTRTPKSRAKLTRRLFPWRFLSKMIKMTKGTMTVGRTLISEQRKMYVKCFVSWNIMLICLCCKLTSQFVFEEFTYLFQQCIWPRAEKRCILRVES